MGCEAVYDVLLRLQDLGQADDIVLNFNLYKKHLQDLKAEVIRENDIIGVIFLY